jgi:acyl-CoA dehydrogenase
MEEIEEEIPLGFELSLEEKMLQRSVRSYMDEKVKPLINEAEKAEKFPWDLLLKDLSQFGYIGGLIPEEDGGYGLSYKNLAILMEEAGRCWGSLRTCMNILMLVPYVIYKHANEAQRKQFLEPILNLEERCWLGLTEPNAGSDAGSIELKAEKKGNHYVLNGSKIFITNASEGNIGVVFAKDKENGGITGFLVHKDVTPYTVRDIPHMPVRATKSCEVIFEDAEVPAENILGIPGKGLRIALDGINIGRLNMAMGSTGIAQACLEASIDYAKNRKQFNKPIGAFQLVQESIVEIATIVETSRLLGYKAAELLDKGERAVKEVSMAKYYCCESATKATGIALQLHGGNGLMEEFPIERYFRDAREGTIPDGTSQMQILIMGRELLGIDAIR